MNLRMGTTLLAGLLACGLAACTSSETSAGGTLGTGGSTSPPVAGLGTLCPPPAQLITDFAYVADAGTADVRFGGNGFLSGGGSFYPATITQDLTQGSWHLSGTVSDYTGFGLYFDNCDRVDASQFKGISFTLSGTVANASPLTMSVNAAGDTASGVWMAANGKTTATPNDVGRCTPTQNTSNQYYTPGCEAPKTSIPIPATPTPIAVTWAQLTGGLPEPTPNPQEITAVSWYFTWASGTAPYAFDIVVDNLALIP